MAAWVGRTATQIAAAVRAGEVTARSVVAEHLDRIAKINAELGAFVRVRSAEALGEAEAIDARADRAELRLAGVPVAIKDNLPVAGEPMRVGSAALPDVPQDKDHPVVARLRAAGAVVVGQTNLPELAIYPFTDSAFGIARNPWDRRRTPGGSSGGAAAAVASAMVPVAQGNDGLGSVRIPAAACGLFGIKPGFGVVPAQIGADSWRGMSENGPLATTVADATLMLEVMAGGSFDLAEPSGLRIAISVKPTGPGVMVHRTFVAAVRQCGDLLATLGHTVGSDDPVVVHACDDRTLVRVPGGRREALPGRLPAGTANPAACSRGSGHDVPAPAPRHRPGTAARGAGAVLRAPRCARHAVAGLSVPGRAAPGRGVVAAQRGRLDQVRPDDRDMEHGWLPGRQRADRGRRRRAPGVGAARRSAGPGIGAARPGRPAGTRP
jgi:Asp-tRNA(Asn)/Glu-tRNA(Gln) amidotransferase A subunit family amidase